MMGLFDWGVFGDKTRDFMFGTPERTEQLQNFTPQQQQWMQQLGQGGLQGMQGLPQQYQQLMQGLNFDPIEQNAMRGFQQNVVPGLAERFSGMGTGGSQQSSAFAQQLGGAGQDLMSQLAALRAQYGLQRGQLGMQGLNQQGNMFGNMANMGLQQQFGYGFHPRSPGMLEQILPFAAKAGMNYMMPGMGGF